MEAKSPVLWGRGLPWRALIIIVAVTAGLKTTAMGLGAAAAESGMSLPALAEISETASVALSERQLVAGAFSAAQITAKTSLHGAPLSVRALRTLGLSLQQQGHLQRAGETMALASALGWRDTPTQLWLTSAFAQQGDFTSAIMHADALARRREAEDEIDAFLLAAALDPVAQSALIKRLQDNPSWQDSIFTSATALPANGRAKFEEFLEELAASSTGVPPAPLAKYVTHIYRLGDEQRARDLWFRYFHDSRPQDVLLFDGGFEHALVGKRAYGSPFEWDIERGAGFDVALLQSPNGDASRGLRIRSDGKITANVASQKLSLAPGSYRLSMKAGVQSAPISTSISWRIVCGSGAQIQLHQGQPEMASDLSLFEYFFTVPALDCDHQTLILSLRSGNPKPVEILVGPIELTASR